MSSPAPPPPLFKKRTANNTLRKKPPPSKQTHTSSSPSSSSSSSDDNDEPTRRLKRQRLNLPTTSSSTTTTNNNTAANPSPPQQQQPDLSTTTKYTGDRTAHIASTSDDAAFKTARSFGPTKANPANVRAITVTDFAPDVCKDYKQTGFCGFGDGCKFRESSQHAAFFFFPFPRLFYVSPLLSSFPQTYLFPLLTPTRENKTQTLTKYPKTTTVHAREDYKQGWELDKDWERVAPSKTRSQKPLPSSLEDEEADEDALLQTIPFACILCRLPYTNPIVTKCGHYFCEACALKRYRKSPSCAACGA
ncbi:MAG: hypothetical protein Q9210_005461, partial [Variospora velana]